MATIPTGNGVRYLRLNPTCVWLLFTWTDGTHDPIEEDYPVHLLVPELLDGTFTDPGHGRYTARWLTGTQAEPAWDTHGIHANTPYR